MDEENGKKLTRMKGDYIHVAAKAAISAVPLVGSSAAEVFSAIVVPPIEKRRDKWIADISAGLDQLEERVGGLIDDLKNNESFISTVMSASVAAIRTHRAEKLRALRNAVLNAALSGAPDDDLQSMFVGLVDNLTVWHLTILKYVADTEDGLKSPFESNDDDAVVTQRLIESIRQHFPLLREETADFTTQIVKDLSARGLIYLGRPQWKVGEGGSLHIRAQRTTLGREFLEFIASPISDD